MRRVTCLWITKRMCSCRYLLRLQMAWRKYNKAYFFTPPWLEYQSPVLSHTGWQRYQTLTLRRQLKCCYAIVMLNRAVKPRLTSLLVRRYWHACVDFYLCLLFDLIGWRCLVIFGPSQNTIWKWPWNIQQVSRHHEGVQITEVVIICT